MMTPIETPKEESQSIFKRLRNLFAIGLALVLLWFVIRSISFTEVLSILQGADLAWLGLAALLNLVMLSLMAYRWYVLYFIDELEQPSYSSLLGASFIAIFFNNFLPSTIGGDAYRAYHAAKENKGSGITGALSIIFVDRVIGLIGLMLVSFIAVFFYHGVLLENSGDLRIWIFFITLALVACLWLGLNERNYERANSLLLRLHIPKREWLQAKLEVIKKHLTPYAKAKSLLFSSLFISVVLRSIWLLSCYFIGLAFHFNVPMIDYFVLIPTIETLRMIPLTIQGLGVREGLFVLFFGQIGLTASEATILGVMVYLFLNINGLIGGLLYLWSRLNQSQKSPQPS